MLPALSTVTVWGSAERAHCYRAVPIGRADLVHQITYVEKGLVNTDIVDLRRVLGTRNQSTISGDPSEADGVLTMFDARKYVQQ